MKGAGSKNAWALFLLLLAGVVLGGFIGELAKGVPALSWLGYGLFRDRRSDRSESRSNGHNIWSIDKDNHGKYHWRDSFHYHISFLIIYRICLLTESVKMSCESEE